MMLLFARQHVPGSSLGLKLIPLAIGAIFCGLDVQAQPSVGVEADLLGGGHYPDNGSGSAGNASEKDFAAHSGLVTGFTNAVATLSSGANGTDANGTSGLIAVQGTALASIGVLRATGTVTASSTSSSSSPHADAELNFGGPPVAQFWDTIMLFNAGFAVGASMPAVLTVRLDWIGNFSGTGNGATSSTVGASQAFTVAGLGTVSAQVGRDSADGQLTGGFTETLAGFILNGVPTAINGSLTITAETSVFGTGLGTTTSSAFTDALDTANFYIDSPIPGTTVTDANGYDYTSPVPEPGSTALALLGVAVCGVFLRFQKRDSAR